MKTTMMGFGLAAAALFVGSGIASAQYTPQIRMVEMVDTGNGVHDGIEYSVIVEPDGSMQSPWPLNNVGARFELWAVVTDPGLTPVILDSKFVGAYAPGGEILVVETPDETTAEGVYRTRVDEGLTVTTEVQGLLPQQPGNPPASTLLRYYRRWQAYPNDGRTAAALDGLRHHATGVLDTDLTNNAVEQHWEMHVFDGLKSKGEFTLALGKIADFQMPAADIDVVYVEVWPYPDGQLLGVDDSNGRVPIVNVVPPIGWEANDMYPTSSVYIRFVDANGDVVGKHSEKVYSYKPPYNIDPPVSDSVALVDDYDYHFALNGDYTIQLVNETPWDLVILDEAQVSVDLTVKVKSSVGTQK